MRLRACQVEFCVQNNMSVKQTSGKRTLHYTINLQEYDAVMLETYELRTSLRGARKELAASLYQHDGACRVIARLTQEKETAMKALEDLRSQFNEFQANPAPQGAAEGPEGPPSKRVRSLQAIIVLFTPS